MNPLSFIRLFHFVLAQGPDINAQVEFFLSFLKDMKEKYEGQQVAVSDKLCDECAESHPEVFASCFQFDEEEAKNAKDGPEAAARPAGAFRDLFAFVIKNPGQVIELINTFRLLFGLSQEAEAEAPATS